MADEIKYFDITVPPDVIKKETYLKVYDAFFKAYRLDINKNAVELDKQKFLKLSELDRQKYLKAVEFERKKFLDAVEIDRKKFLNELELNIYSKIKYGKSSEKGKEGRIYVSGRHNVQAINHRPQIGGNTSSAMLMVTPRGGYVRFHTFSYGGEKDYVSDFIKNASKSLSKKNGSKISGKFESIDDKVE